MKLFFKSIFFLKILSLFFLSNCSSNVLSKWAPQSEDDYKIAQEAMEKRDFASAKTHLEKRLTQDPQDYNAIALLAACYGALAEVILLDILVNTQSSGGQGTTGSDFLSQSSFLLPPNTDENRERMGMATNLMGSIPSDQKTPSMNFQEGIFLSIKSLLQLNHLKENTESLRNLTPDEAISIIKDLANATEVLSAISVLAPATKNLEEINDYLKTNDGPAAVEKLNEFLAGGGTLPTQYSGG